MEIHLTEEWERFVREEVRSGRFASESHLMGEALALLRRREEARADRLTDLTPTSSAPRPIGETIDERTP